MLCADVRESRLLAAASRLKDENSIFIVGVGGCYPVAKGVLLKIPNTEVDSLPAIWKAVVCASRPPSSRCRVPLHALSTLVFMPSRAAV